MTILLLSVTVVFSFFWLQGSWTIMGHFQLCSSHRLNELCKTQACSNARSLGDVSETHAGDDPRGITHAAGKTRPVLTVLLPALLLSKP